MKMKSALLSLGTVALLAVGISGCSTPAPAAPSSSAAVEQTPSPTPTPTAEESVSLVVTSSGLELHTGDAVTASWNYDAIDDAAVAGIGAVLGFEPVVATASTSCEGGSCLVTSWTWEGLELRLRDVPTPVGAGFVSVTAPTVSGIPIFAADGSAVGDDAAPIIAANPEGLEQIDEYSVVWVGRTPVENAQREDAFRAVSLILDADHALVSRIGAPSANYGM